MADDPKKQAQDAKLIALTQEHEVKYWTKALGCTEEELKAAVDKVGRSAAKVKEYFATKKKAKK